VCGRLLPPPLIELERGAIDTSTRRSPTSLLSCELDIGRFFTAVIMQRRAHHLSAYSSASSDSSVSSHSPDPASVSAVESDAPPAAFPLLFRRNSSLESSRSYESPDDDDEEQQEEIESEDERRDGISLRTPRLGMRPHTIEEEEPPIDSALQIARTQSMPLPHHGASPTTPSGSSALPGAQPGLGSSISWTPGLAPPAPYVAIVPLHPSDHDSTLLSSMHIGSGGLSDAPLEPFEVVPFDARCPLLTSPLMVDLSRAPPPSRAPSLVRQKGVYVEHTSRALSMPHDMRERYHRQLEREVTQRDREHRAHATGQVTPPTPLAHDADDDDLPPL
jgi:hypothetical protein